MLARYCDFLLKKSSKILQEAEVEDILTEIVSRVVLLRWIGLDFWSMKETRGSEDVQIESLWSLFIYRWSYSNTSLAKMHSKSTTAICTQRGSSRICPCRMTQRSAWLESWRYEIMYSEFKIRVDSRNSRYEIPCNCIKLPLWSHLAVASNEQTSCGITYITISNCHVWGFCGSGLLCYLARFNFKSVHIFLILYL